MNKVIIIGNLTRDPQTRYTAGGKQVTSFTVAVNRRTQKDHPEADFFRVSCWEGLAGLAEKYLQKGKKVCVTGPVRCMAFSARDGSPAASMEVTAHELEFLTPRGTADPQTGYAVTEEEELPF